MQHDIRQMIEYVIQPNNNLHGLDSLFHAVLNIPFGICSFLLSWVQITVMAWRSWADPPVNHNLTSQLNVSKVFVLTRNVIIFVQLIDITVFYKHWKFGVIYKTMQDTLRFTCSLDILQIPIYLLVKINVFYLTKIESNWNYWHTNKR